MQMHDKAFLMGQVKASMFDLDSRQLAAYFSADNCVRGLAILCERLFGLELRETTMPASEDWTRNCGSEVRKLELREGGALLGVIYLDLFRRPNKFDGSSCFVIRCQPTLLVCC